MTGIRINLAAGVGQRGAAGDGRRRGEGPWGILRRGGRSVVAGGGAGGLLLLLIAGGALHRMSVRHAEVQARVGAAVADSLHLAASLERLREIRAEQDSLTAGLATVQALEPRVPAWPRLLTAIAAARPAHTWIDRIQALPESESLPGTVRFRLLGVAGSSHILSEFLRGLEAAPEIGKVTLSASEPGELQGRAVQHFAVEGQYAGLVPLRPDSSKHSAPRREN